MEPPHPEVPPDPTATPEVARTMADLHGHLTRLESLLGGSVQASLGAIGAEGPEGHRPSWARPASGEERWPVALAILVAIVLQVALPDRLTLGTRWLLPALEAALLVGLVAANPRKIDRRSAALRSVTVVLVALSSLANGWSTYELVRGLVVGTAGRSAAPLLTTGGSIYLTNVIVFSLWYWEVDRGGPAARAEGSSAPPDFAFPQMTTPEVAPRGWRPTYLDYLYTSYTNATAFSPTDTMPLSHLAKALMGAQSAVALVTVALVVARAVNILS